MAKITPPCSDEIVATVWGGDQVGGTLGGNYYNICSNHVEEYRKGGWKTLEMYPPLTVEPEGKPIRPDPTKLGRWTEEHFKMLCTCGEEWRHHRGCAPYEFVDRDNGCKGFVDSGKDKY